MPQIHNGSRQRGRKALTSVRFLVGFKFNFLKEHERLQLSVWPFSEGVSPATSQIILYPTPTQAGWPGRAFWPQSSLLAPVAGQVGQQQSLFCQPAPEPSPLHDHSPWSQLGLQPEAPRVMLLAKPRPPPKFPTLSRVTAPCEEGRKGGEPLGRVAVGGQYQDICQDKLGQPSPRHRELSVRATPSPVCNLGGSCFFTQRRPIPRPA